MKLSHLMPIVSQESTKLGFSAANWLNATPSEELLESPCRKWRKSIILVIGLPSTRREHMQSCLAEERLLVKKHQV